MKVKSKRDQIQNAIADLRRLLDWQTIKVRRAQKRYNIKCDWIVAFWIMNDSSTLKYVLDQEQAIWNELNDYREELSRQLSNCD